jgi:serine protease Do
MSRITIIGAMVASVALSVGCTLGVLYQAGFLDMSGRELMYKHKVSYTAAPVTRSIVSQGQFMGSSPTSFTKAAARTMSGVVYIQSLAGSNVVQQLFNPDDFHESSGSGVIISTDGYIVTNNHVVEEGSDIRVTLHDKQEYLAEVVGTDPNTDIALLKIKPEKPLPYLTFGNSDTTMVGEWVLAVGNPFNLNSTVTAGIISAKGRNIDILEAEYSIESFIQTDAAVNPGNSGGALVNLNGDLIGINTAIMSKTGISEGYSFAIPSNLVRKIIADIKDYGIAQRGFLGINIKEVTPEMAKQLKLESLDGVYLTHVIEGGGAFDAGLKEGDILLKVNNKAITSVAELQEVVGGMRPGDMVNVLYYRTGSVQEKKVTLKNDRNTTDLNKYADQRNTMKKYGFEVRNLTMEEATNFKAKGIKVTSITANGVLDKVNMKPDFVIAKINGKPIQTTDDFFKTFEALATESLVEVEGFYPGYKGTHKYKFDKH